MTPGDRPSIADTGAPESGPLQRRPRHFVSAPLWFIAILLVLSSWSLASPLMSAPDESTQVIQAAALVRGQFDVPLSPGPFGRWSEVQVPAFAAESVSLPGCYANRPRVPADCSPKLTSSSRLMPAATQFSNYPPLYFGIVGLPTLVASGSGAVYAMRLVGDVVMAAWVALGIGLLVRFHRRPGTTIGALAALSPMAFFVMSVVNDSALEIASGFAAWCGALCVVDQDVVPRGLAFFTGASLVVFILSRPLSPLYALVVVALSLVLAGRERRRHLLRQAPVRAIGIAGAIAGGVALVLLLIGGPPSLLGPHPGRPLTLVGAAELSLRQTFRRLGQAIGDFGWIDTPVPVGTTVVWILAVGGLVLSACWASRSCRKALLVLVAVVLLSPVVFEAPRINAVGLYWQSRYWLPLLVGVPLMSVTYLRRPRRLHAKRTRPWTRPVLIVATLGGAGALFVAQLAAFLTALHRYEVGLGAPAGAPTKWTPPGGGPLLIALFTTGYVLLVLLVLSQRRQAFERPG